MWQRWQRARRFFIRLLVGSLSRCAARARPLSSGTELPPRGRASGPCGRDGPARSQLVHRTTARLVDTGRGQGVVADSAGIYRQHARSGLGCLAHASAADRVVATRDGSAWLPRLVAAEDHWQAVGQETVSSILNPIGSVSQAESPG